MPRVLSAATVLAATAMSMASIPPIDNAALQYLRADPIYDRAGISEIYDAMQEDDGVLAPGSEGAKAMIERQQVVDLALKGAFMDECDFEVDYSQGFDTLLPHLGQVRALSKLVAVDARRLEVAGDVSGSATRTAALYRMADHISEDGVLIGSLVGMAIANVANQQTARLAGKELSDKDRKLILDAIDVVSTDDPFNVLTAIEMEKEIIVSWLPQKFSGEDAGRQFLEGMTMFGEGPTAEQREVFGSMDEQAFLDAVDLAASSYDEVIAAFDAPDMAERLADIERRVADGEFGPVALVAVPSFGKVFENATRARGDLAAAREQLDKDDE